MTTKEIFTKTAGKLYQLSTLGLHKGPHITRYYMYNHLSQYAKPRAKDLKVLSISHSQYLGKLLGFNDEQITDVSYPEFNILDLPFRDGEFDAVVSDQVLEHVEGDPQLAIDEMFRILKPQGISLQTTCFINPVHGCPNDYWRFTPNALKLLTKKHGKILDVGGWGNPYAWLLVAMDLRMAPIPEANWHPAHWLATNNNPKWPISTWILAQKFCQ